MEMEMEPAGTSDHHGGGMSPNPQAASVAAAHQQQPSNHHPTSLSEALRAILFPNETAQSLFRRARTKPFRTGLAIFDMAEQFMYGGGMPSSSSSSSSSSTSSSSTSSSSSTINPSSSSSSSKSRSSRGGGADLVPTQEDLGAGSQQQQVQGQQQRGVRGGDVVEFCGKAGSGKSALLLQVVASAILPPVWRYRAVPNRATSANKKKSLVLEQEEGGADASEEAVERRLELDGEGVGVVFFDNDLKFNVLRLERLLRARIRRAVERQAEEHARERARLRGGDQQATMEAARRKRQRVETTMDTEADRSYAHYWTTELEDELIEECLGRLIVHRCEDSLQFLTTLQMTDELIRNLASPSISIQNGSTTRSEGSKGTAPVEVKVLVIDSIGAFHNADRIAEGGFSYGGGGFGNKRGGGSRSRMPKIVHTLKQLVNVHNLIVFAGKGAPYGKLTRQTVLNSNVDPHQEFLGDAWQNFVKYRLLLVREEEELGGRPSLSACINKPSLTLSLPSTATSGRPSLAGAVTRVRTKLFPFGISEEGPQFYDSDADRHKAT